ncbi:hypothetical protein LTR84_000761 [Exophiala bonariae]|uniref:Uncharacterized protein n=1 Tax=Exophiala bonariae TaxID=1690606 RepID=A0AAV9NUZ3_9EURO|nr:hypothetical protein LTR84_000761 [Exophiala bonariae]
MQVAAFLSDLKSLSICSHAAAIALVKPDVGGIKDDLSVHTDQKSSATSDIDRDLQRAEELVLLHYDVKVKHLKSGLGPEIIEARRRVDEVMAALS